MCVDKDKQCSSILVLLLGESESGEDPDCLPAFLRPMLVSCLLFSIQTLTPINMNERQMH